MFPEQVGGENEEDEEEEGKEDVYDDRNKDNIYDVAERMHGTKSSIHLSWLNSPVRAGVFHCYDRFMAADRGQRKSNVRSEGNR